MSVTRPKRVIRIREQKSVLPKILPPMERPQTPRLDNRSAGGTRAKTLHNLSISRFADLPDIGVSTFEEITELIKTANTTEDLSAAMKKFVDASASLAQTGQFAACDLNAYHKLYPLLQPLVDSAPGPVLFGLLKALLNCVKGIRASSALKPKPVSVAPKSLRKVSRLQKLAPLKEAGEEHEHVEHEPVEHEPVEEDKDAPTEHFFQFMAKIMYKMSSDKGNDRYFEGDSMVASMVSFSTARHKLDTRVYAVAAMKNEAHSATFRQKLVATPKVAEIFQVLNATTKKPQLLIQCTGLLRNLILDVENLDLLVKNEAHVLLFGCLERFPESPELVFNCFRILTKVSERDEVREEILKRFGAEAVLSKFIDLMVRHQENHQILSRIGYVFADFAAYEESLLAVAGEASHASEVEQIAKLLENDALQNDREVAAMVVQVIANLSVSEKCSAILKTRMILAYLLVGSSFDEGDRLGLNLLCCASNFTYHDHKWAPTELINAIPKAIVSKYLPSIVEALRTLCNLALSPSERLVESKIPELLGILLKHVNSDIVLYSMQTLANLINQKSLRSRFRKSGCLATIFERLEQEEIDAMELEAIAALIMNFNEITPQEAQTLIDALNEYEISDEDQMMKTFRDFLKKKVRVDG